MYTKGLLKAGSIILMLCLGLVIITNAGCYRHADRITETLPHLQQADTATEKNATSAIMTTTSDEPDSSKSLPAESTKPTDIASDHTPKITATLEPTNSSQEQTAVSSQTQTLSSSSGTVGSAITSTKTKETTMTTVPSTTPTTTPQPTLSPSPTTTTTRDVPQLRQEMFDATNALRTKQDLPSLAQGSAKLQEIAMIRAKELATLYSHKRPDGTYVDTLLKANDISYMCAAENIANFSELGTVTTVINAWASSSGHLLSITRPEHDTLAIGYYECPYGRQYWVQIFTGKTSW